MMATPFSAEAVMAGLKSFQRNTVEHVIDRLYRGDGRRFLVADETGLGKTMVARGVIARAIEELENDEAVQRIDIVYVCSNADIAQQNLNALDVTGGGGLGIASRLTLLAKHTRDLQLFDATFSKKVNLISFTPGTSFQKGWQTGTAEERAMLYLLLEDRLDLRGARATTARRLLKGTVKKLDTFTSTIDYLEGDLGDGIDPKIATGFLRAAEAELIPKLNGLIDELGRRQVVPDDLRTRTSGVIGDMRATLARVSVELLEPDLVILDEFQRFRDLLDPETEAGELAHHLFDFEQARVLLLSATPYKPFSYAEEADKGEAHHASFMETVRFLATPLETDLEQKIAAGLASYRANVVRGQRVEPDLAAVRTDLLQIMTRTERPRSIAATMSLEAIKPATRISDDDMLGYVAMRRLASAVDGLATVEYWKSAPYFVNFMDGYKIADQVRAALRAGGSADVKECLRHTRRLDLDAMRRYEQIDLGNARMRQLASETVDEGWWRLLWLPPSVPYLQLDGPYADGSLRRMTKRLIFSSWSATPTSVATILSYEAERRIAEGSRVVERTPETTRAMASRLNYRLTDGHPASMTTLALFWPMPELARLADPRELCRDVALTSDDLVRMVAARLGHVAGSRSTARGTVAESAYWVEAFARTSRPRDLTTDEIISYLSGVAESEDDEAEAEHTNLARHVAQALEHREAADVVPPDLGEVLATLAAYSPANIAYRALHRVASGDVTEAGLWSAAAIVASSFRTLFARSESAMLLDKLMPDGLPYWRAILRYCAWGDLQAVMDEYVHHLAEAERLHLTTDDRLMCLAEHAATAISLRPARYGVFDPDDPTRTETLRARFALRYGTRRVDQESVRLPQVRRAFNSPFWPFVLATTSVGQEGIDFHWWCHAVQHWNTPANPVDFEQREGRVDRYNGHAIRKNIAARHAREMLASADADPWVAAYRIATDESERLGEFAPHWVYPGPARIERHVAPFPLSLDEGRLARIKEDVALYRLTFGQPRQEDMLQLLRLKYDEADPDEVARMRLDLRAPMADGDH